MISCENGRSCMPPARRRFNAGGFTASYLAIIQLAASRAAADTAAVRSRRGRTPQVADGGQRRSAGSLARSTANREVAARNQLTRSRPHEWFPLLRFFARRFLRRARRF